MLLIISKIFWAIGSTAKVSVGESGLVVSIHHGELVSGVETLRTRFISLGEATNVVKSTITTMPRHRGPPACHERTLHPAGLTSFWRSTGPAGERFGHHSYTNGFFAAGKQRLDGVMLAWKVRESGCMQAVIDHVEWRIRKGYQLHDYESSA